MPSYDFKCKSCNHVFEKFFSVHDEHRANCEKCLGTHTFRYMGNNSVAVHGFTTFADPRGGDGRLTLKEINAIEKRDNLVYGNHEDIRKEAKKNKEYNEKKTKDKLEKIIDKSVTNLHKKYNS